MNQTTSRPRRTAAWLFIRGGLLLSCALAGFGAARAGSETQPAVPPVQDAKIGKREYLDYIDAFNRRDYEGFGKFYGDDVVLNLAGKKELRGRRAIIEFYREVHRRIRETLTVRQLVVDESGVAAELATEFYCTEDWPEFIAGPIRKGETIRIVSMVFYRTAQGKFTTIETARVKQ
jgi:ketosteroid isomerase-like protein